MKKRNKKYVKKPAPARMWSWESDRGTEAQFVSAQVKMAFGWVTVDGQLAMPIVRQARNWMLMLRVILWYPDGKVDIQTAITHKRGVNLNALEEESKAMRAEIIKTAKMEHIVDIGWLAETFDKVPRDTEQDMHEIGDITEQRQMLWNYSFSEEVKAIVA